MEIDTTGKTLPEIIAAIAEADPSTKIVITAADLKTLLVRESARSVRDSVVVHYGFGGSGGVSGAGYFVPNGGCGGPGGPGGARG